MFIKEILSCSSSVLCFRNMMHIWEEGTSVTPREGRGKERPGGQTAVRSSPPTLCRSPKSPQQPHPWASLPHTRSAPPGCKLCPSFSPLVPYLAGSCGSSGTRAGGEAHGLVESLIDPEVGEQKLTCFEPPHGARFFAHSYSLTSPVQHPARGLSCSPLYRWGSRGTGRQCDFSSTDHSLSSS